MSEEDGLSPRENFELIGHKQAEQQLLEAYNSGALPHAWLITGPRGVGKATLAYRFARFLLTSEPIGDTGQDGLFGDALPKDSPTSLEVDPENPVISRITNNSHGDLLVLDTENLEDDKARKEISVDEARKVAQFLSLTPSESAWRVVIIDSTDEMNRNAANAILKILEEPPAQAVILLVSHQPGKLLPTIRSRCRELRLNPLENTVINSFLQQHFAESDPAEARFTASLAQGSPGLSLELYSKHGFTLYKGLLEVFSTLPSFDMLAAQSFADKIAGKGKEDEWRLTMFLIEHFLASAIKGAAEGEWGEELILDENAIKAQLTAQVPLDQLVGLWETIGRMAKDVQWANMDRKHSFITMCTAMQKAVA